jgi:transcriptional repressor NrdR
MKCPFCGYQDSKVIDSRSSDGGNVIRRRRECLECKSRFTTFERYEQIPSVVIKRSGERVPYKREKIMVGLSKAFEKRPVSKQKVEELLESIEAELRAQGEREIKSSLVGMIVLKKLKEIDEVAYLRFASVYKDFQDVSQFQEELGELMKKTDK